MNVGMNSLVLYFLNDIIEDEYVIKVKCATMENTQVNSILERIHQVIEKLVCTFNLQNIYRDEDDPWSGIIASTDFSVHSMYHTTLQYTPGQLVSVHYITLNTPFIAY